MKQHHHPNFLEENGFAFQEAHRQRGELIVGQFLDGVRRDLPADFHDKVGMLSAFVATFEHRFDGNNAGIYRAGQQERLQLMMMQLRI